MKYVLSFIRWITELNIQKFTRTVLVLVSVLCVLGYIQKDKECKQMATEYFNLYKKLYNDSRAELDSLKIVVEQLKHKK